MKIWKNIKKKLPVLLLLLGLLNFNCTPKTNQHSYFFNPTTGDDANSGASAENAFKSLASLKKLQLKAGDTIFLAAGETFTEALQLQNVSGSSTQPIVVSTYPKNSTQKAFISTKGIPNAVRIENASFIEIENLDITAQSLQLNTSDEAKMRCGILVTTSKIGKYEHIYLSNLTVHDVFFQNEGFTRPKGEVNTANGTQAYGWGIRFINNTEGAILKDLKVENTNVENVAHTGIKLTSRLKNGVHGITDFEISNNQVLKTGGPGIQMSGVANGHIYNNKVDHSGSNDDSRKWGRGSGLWTWGSTDILIEHNRFTNANGPGDSAGAHIDYNCNNIVLQYNFSMNNAGGFCEILGNNYNCAYRYNISVNDGHRIKGENGAFQEGKTFWLSGYAGKKRLGPFNSYFYNNSIYVGKHITPKVAIHRKAKGVLIANNIFHFENAAEIVKGDQYNPETAGDWQVTNVVFSNNLFLANETWPEELPIQDENALLGNADFKAISSQLADFIPMNTDLVKNKGIEIPKIPMDSIGLIYGLQVEKDILGNSVKGLPDLGAIEVEE